MSFVVHIHTEYDHTLGLRVPKTENAYKAMRGFQELGCHIKFFDTQEELDLQLSRGDVVVGYISNAIYAFDRLEVERPATIDYPHELQPFYGRRIWRGRLSEVADHPETWPIFVKSQAQKGFTGKVIRTVKDLQGTAYQNHDRDVIMSEVVEFVSEWRGFVRHGTIYDLRSYSGRWDVFPDFKVVQNALEAWKTRPAGCSIDFGVTSDGRTLVIECNDGFALGSYGLNHLKYAKLISARWHEIVGQMDPFLFLK